MQKKDIIIAGISRSSLPDEVRRILSEEEIELLVSSDYSKKLVSSFPKGNRIKKTIPFTPIVDCFKDIERSASRGRVLVLTSGDPLFFGFGTSFLKRLPEAEVAFIPSVSSMQFCFSRFGIPWEEAQFISLHGRDIEGIASMINNKLLFFLTDKNNTPDRIATFIMNRIESERLDDYTIHIGEKLGQDGERLISGGLAKISTQSFEQPNCVIITNRQTIINDYPSKLGLKESEINHSRGLITKNEIRAMVLHALDLPHDGVFWDVGAGSGSVSIEAARMNPGLSIYAIEKNEVERVHIEQNRRRFGCWNIHVIAGKAPEVFTDLPKPDRVFVGGSGGQLIPILEQTAALIGSGQKIVVTGILESTKKTAPETLVRLGLSVSSSLVSVTRICHYGDSSTEKKLNPIQITIGSKK